MSRTLHPEWRESHSPTKYPFADAATLTNGAQFIPETIFLDAVLYPIGGRERMYLTKVVITHETATIYIGDIADKERASAAFAMASPPESLVVADAYGRPAGLFVSEAARLAIFQSWPVGTHEFTAAQTEFVADVCVPTPELGFRGFVLSDGSIFTEDIWLLAEDGIVFTPEEGSVIRVDVVGDPLFRRRLCAGIFDAARFLRLLTIQNQGESFSCGPGANGSFKITTAHQDTDAPVLRIRSTPEGLLIEAIGEKLEDAR